MSRTKRRHLLTLGIDAKPHQFSHTFATEMARMANGDLLAVPNVMGHESPATTRRYVGWAGHAAPIIASLFPGSADEQPPATGA